MTPPGRPAGASEHAVELESERLLQTFDQASTLDELLGMITAGLAQAQDALQTGDGVHHGNTMVRHNDARLTRYCIAGGPLDQYYRARFGPANGGRAPLDALFAEAFG